MSIPNLGGVIQLITNHSTYHRGGMSHFFAVQNFMRSFNLSLASDHSTYHQPNKNKKKVEQKK
jgi:hypothetical protein